MVTDTHRMTEAGTAPTTELPRTPGRGLLDTLPFLLIRAAHPRQALLTAAGLALAALLAGRPVREIVLVGATVLVGQTVLGWHNDLVDRDRDRRHPRAAKPVAGGRLEPGTLWFWLCCAVLLLVPLAVANGVAAGLCYLGSVLIGMLGNLHSRLLRHGPLSWLPWVAAFALYPGFLSLGGWGGQTEGAPPEPAIVALAALVGVGVHLVTALWGLVADDADGWTYLPLRLGRRLGATRLLVVTLVYLGLILAALGAAAAQIGLSA